MTCSRASTTASWRGRVDVPERVIVLGSVTDRHEVETLMAQRHPEVGVDSCGESRELVERASAGRHDVALLLKASIGEHQQRMETIAKMRRNGFDGRILLAGAFLTERQEAIEAGADYVFDPVKQPVEEVIHAALTRPVAAADHPYLRYLLIGEWAQVQGYAVELPGTPPDLLLTATSCHGDPGFYAVLAGYSKANPETRCILVDDGGDEEAEVAALASGVQPLVALAEEGLPRVAVLAHAFLQEAWLRRVKAV